jgi:hypothetical protein
LVTPAGAAGMTDNHPTSVFYDGTSGYWSIVNTDGAAMPAFIAFNIFIPPDSRSPFTIVSSGLNIAGNTVYINDQRTHHHPEAALLVTQIKTAVSNHNIGVKYDPVQAEWGIMNEDGAAMANGMEFNVLVLTPNKVYLPLIKH